MGAEDDDWRLTGQDEYMSGVTLVWLPYRQWSETWDHDHCMFCWAKFVPEGSPTDGEAEHEGYTNEGVPDVADHYWWICKGCFDDFEGRFGWKVRDP